ncbi:cytochrome c family protein [Sphingomonas lutea]|uniref:Cytochrome c family protein n=1 Tax=Sphingomonas lutea TaxID=1045317 RepID=A0A7G9SJN4_9SPHN|nr:cytochrome c family protein [Sphingomonas lutea]QNN68059.1 cytochrome c family protein [Sphingomonas lutea]
MDDRFNTIAGWVLFAGIVALGSSIVAGEVFHSERPETMGYPIEGVVLEGEDGAEAEKPIAFYLASADAAKGEQVFKKCAACHNAEQGGANALGPNLYAIMGAPHASKPGFAYTDALKSKPGNWDWQSMSDWLKNPKAYAPGTKMTFAGLSKPEDRANLMVWLNSKGSNLPLPAAPAAGAEPADDAAAKAGTGAGDGAQKAENEPVLTEQQTGSNPKNVGGEGASKLTGPASAKKTN